MSLQGYLGCALLLTTGDRVSWILLVYESYFPLIYLVAFSKLFVVRQPSRNMYVYSLTPTGIRNCR